MSDDSPYLTGFPPVPPKPIDLDACAKAAADCWHGQGAWDDNYLNARDRWRAAAAAVLKAAGVKT